MKSTQISRIHGESLEDVKTKITSITYGGLNKEFNYKTLPNIYSMFYDENKGLSDFVYNNINQIKDKDFDAYLNDKLSKLERGKKKKNVVIYSFMEYYEKLIRDIFIENSPVNSR